jgi:hypothetical protein
MLFPNLPGELRCLIWAQTFSPRIIPLVVESYGTSSETGLYIRVPIPARVTSLETCKESRLVALRSGYKSWKVVGSDGISNMMWNPRIDVVNISGTHVKEMSMHMIQSIFPSETMEITKLALPTSVLARGSPYDRRQQLANWFTSAALRELILVCDIEYEEECVQSAREMFNESKAASCPWSIPRDVEYSLRTTKDLAWGYVDWKLPSVRVVGNEEGIINGETLQLNLRCWPCKDIREI